jgi:hypothetical protein
LPVVGTPARFLLDYGRLGVSQYGYILGTLRGGLAGLVMFIMMLTLTEVIPLGWEVVHYYLDQRYVEPVKSEERVMLIETIREKYERRSGLHPTYKHWHEKFGDGTPLEFLNPGNYLLTEHPSSETQHSQEEDR